MQLWRVAILTHVAKAILRNSEWMYKKINSLVFLKSQIDENEHLTFSGQAKC